MAVCKRCGREIKENDVFCPYCGAHQQSQQSTKTCPNCHREVRQDENFCSYCGTRVSQPSYTYTQSFYDSKNDFQQEEKEPKKNPWLDKKMWAIFLGLIVLTLIATFYYGDGSSLSLIEDPISDLNNPINPDYEYDNTFDGSLETKAESSVYYGNLNNGGYIFGDSEYLYAINNDGALIKRHHLTNEETVISDDVSGYVQVYKDTLYYTDETNHYLYRVDENNQSHLVIGEAVYYVVIYNDKIYFQRDGDGESIYSSLLDGTEMTKLNDSHSYNITIYNDQLYYTTSNEGINRMNLDGTSQTQISNESAYGLSIANDKVYFINQEDTLLYSMSLSGQDRQVVYGQPIVEFVVDEDVVYFSNTSLNIGRVSVNGTGAEIFNCTGTHLQVIGDYLFYQEYNSFFGNYGDWECCYKDGTNRQAPYTSENYEYI